MVRQFFRELFARDNTDGDMRCEAEAEHPPSVYDTMIDDLEGEIIGLRSLLDYHERQAETVGGTLQHKREQLAVLRAHRDEERDEPPLGANAGGWNGCTFPTPTWDGKRFTPGACSCSLCRARGSFMVD